METLLYLVTGALVLFVGLFLLAWCILKREEAKLKRSNRELAITLKDYAFVLRVYRDILKAKKDGTYEEYKVPM